MAVPGEVYDQEVLLENAFKALSDGFRKLDRIGDAGKQAPLLKEFTAQMQEAKILIRDFEREAATDGMDPAELSSRKKALIQELNGYIGLKKAYSSQSAARDELLGDAPSVSKQMDAMENAQLMNMGRRDMNETNQSLLRSERIVNDTIAVGAETAETLQHQGEQLEKVMDDLDEIEFTMKKATQIMKDMARGVTTDKCLMVLILLVVGAIVAVIVVKVLKSKNVIKKGDASSAGLAYEPGLELLLPLLGMLPFL